MCFITGDVHGDFRRIENFCETAFRKTHKGKYTAFIFHYFLRL